MGLEEFFEIHRLYLSGRSVYAISKLLERSTRTIWLTLGLDRPAARQRLEELRAIARARGLDLEPDTVHFWRGHRIDHGEEPQG